MKSKNITRRDWMIRTASALAAGAAALPRMKWWHEARFGMFIHWGLVQPSAGTNG
jgi:hypothetical protein